MESTLDRYRGASGLSGALIAIGSDYKLTPTVLRAVSLNE